MIVFFDIRDIIHHEYAPVVQTVTGQLYAGVLEWLRPRVFCVSPELAENGYILQHNNAPTHSSFIVQKLLAKKGTPTLPHPPYSPIEAQKSDS